MTGAAVRGALCAIALLSGVAREATAQIIEYGPGKIAEVYERNAAGERIREDRVWNSGLSAYWAVLGLGNNVNALGESADAQAWVDDGGTFWAVVNADNNNAPYQDWGNGEAATTLAYGMHKPKDVPGEVTLELSGGRLELVDYGGGSAPLEAAVLLQVEFRLGGTPSDPDEFFATLTGRGGSIDAETFDWSQQRFDLTEASYTESGFSGNVFSAELVIPAQTITYGLEYLCEECDFELWVTLSVIANNPGGETKAYASYRDPVHAGDPDPALGGARVSWEGVTLVPEPSRGGECVALAAALLVGWRARSRG